MSANAFRESEQFTDESEYKAYLSHFKLGEWSGRLMGSLILQDLENQELSKEIIQVFDDNEELATKNKSLVGAHNELAAQYEEVLNSGILELQAHYRSEKLREQALTDDLTGLPNRRALRAAYETSRAAANGQRHSDQLSLMFIDVDKFKTSNDRYGQEGGDIILKEIGRRLKINFRSTDTIGRLGGDEFFAIMSSDSLETAEIRAKNLHDTVNAPIDVSGESALVTVSVGICPLNPEHSFENAYGIASKVMKEAKGSDSDRTVVFSDQVS